MKTMDPKNPYYAYYKAQAGGSAEPYYQSRFAVQGGRGIFGNLLKGAWGFLRPLFGSAAKHLGAEALSAGSNIVRDSIASPGEPVADIARKRAREGLANLANRAASALTGSGKRTRRKAPSAKTPRKKQKMKKKNKTQSGSDAMQYARTRRTSQSTRGRRRGGSSSINRAPAIRDIFSPPSP